MEVYIEYEQGRCMNACVGNVEVYIEQSKEGVHALEMWRYTLNRARKVYVCVQVNFFRIQGRKCSGPYVTLINIPYE